MATVAPAVPTLAQATGAAPAVPPVAAPTVAPQQAAPNYDDPQIATQAANMTKAIFQHESGTNYKAVGDNGTSNGAGQWQAATWATQAKDVLGDADAPMTPANQSIVAQGIIRKMISQGLNAAQIAATWNRGSPDNWESKVGTNTINGKQISYNVPKYVKAVTDLYQQYKTGNGPSPDTSSTATADNPAADIAAQRAALQAAGQPVSVNQNKAQPSFFGGLIRGLISPIVRGVNTIAEPIEKATGTAPSSEYSSYLGDISGLGMKEGQTTTQRVEDVAGGLANLASDFIGGGAAKDVAETGLEGLLKQGLIKGAKEGAIAGGLGGLGGGLQNPDNGSESAGEQALNIAKTTAEGAAGGAVTGGAFGGITGGAGVLKKLAFGADTSAGQDAVARLAQNPVVQKRASVIQQLGDNYASVGKVIQKAKSQGIDLPTILASTDLLHDTVDNTGTIRTQAAVDELNQFLKEGPEQVVSQNLRQEGVKVPLKDVQAQLNKAVNESSLTGSSKVTALNSVRKEVAGLQLDTDKDGNIPLETIHQAKVNKYANVNHMNPESGTADKLIGKTLKGIVEDNTKSVNVKNLNAELAQHYATLNLLEKLNGKKVQGGKLGKYFAQTIGGIVGSHFGPLGTIAGAELGGAIKGKALSSVFGGKIGTDLASSDAMKAAIESANAPRSVSVPVTHLPTQYTNDLPTIPFGRTPKPTIAGPVVNADTAPNVISPFGNRGVKPVIPLLKKK